MVPLIQGHALADSSQWMSETTDRPKPYMHSFFLYLLTCETVSFINKAQQEMSKENNKMALIIHYNKSH